MDKSCCEEIGIYEKYDVSPFEDFSVDTVSDLLLPTGLLTNRSVQYVGNFERYVYLHGSREEIYTKQENDFISAIDKIVIFSEYTKKNKNEIIPCRVVAVRNLHFDILPFSIAFTKLMNKASDGLNICVVLSAEGIIFTCRSYNDSSSNGYHISNIITTNNQMEELSDELIYLSDYDDFFEYYSNLKESIQFREKSTDYLLDSLDTNWLSYSSYIEELQSLELSTGLSFAGEIRRFYRGAEDHYQVTYDNRVAEANEYLFRIETSHINTMEMLIEAEEKRILISERIQQHERELEGKINAASSECSIRNAESEAALLKHPESLIKILKKKWGI